MSQTETRTRLHDVTAACCLAICHVHAPCVVPCIYMYCPAKQRGGQTERERREGRRSVSSTTNGVLPTRPPTPPILSLRRSPAHIGVWRTHCVLLTVTPLLPVRKHAPRCHSRAHRLSPTGEATSDHAHAPSPGPRAIHPSTLVIVTAPKLWFLRRRIGWPVSRRNWVRDSFVCTVRINGDQTGRG
jgi:hypothetical protein